MANNKTISLNFEVEIVRDFESFFALRDEWNALLNEMTFFFPSMAFDWIHAWVLANKGCIRELYVILFRDAAGKLVGIVPLYIYERRKFSIRIRVMDFLGGKDRYLVDFIAPMEHLLYIIRSTLHIINEDKKSWDIVTIRRLNNWRASAVHLEQVLRYQHSRFNTESFFRVPEIRLAGTFEDYYSGLNKKFRKEMRRKNRKLKEVGEVRYEFSSLKENPDAMNTFLELEDAGWKGRNGSSLKRRKGLLRLQKQLIEDCRDNVELLTFNMYLNDEPIASSICTKTSHAIYIDKITYSETYSVASPGLHLRLYEIQYAFDNQLKVYSFSGVERSWMHFFTRRGHFSMDFVIYNNHFLSMVRFLGYTKLKPLLKSYPSLFSFIKGQVSSS